MADVCISKYLDEIWFADRLSPSEGSDINNTKPEVVFSDRGRHVKKMDMTSYFRSGASILMKFGCLMQNNMQITANCMVKIETGSRILIWRTFLFQKRK